MRMIIGAMAALLAVALIAGCTQSLDSEDVVQTDRVAVGDNRFGPRVIEVPAGTTVTWTWEGKRPHDVVGEGWGSDVVTTGSFQHTFDAAGTFDYRCTLHGGMTGRVVVTP